MRKKNKQQIITYVIGILLASLFLVGCGLARGGETEMEETQTGQLKEMSGLYLILENDTREEAMMVYSYETEREDYYEYSFATVFRDKYGNLEPGINFTPGRIVTLGEKDSQGYLTEVQLSDEVWEYEKVRRFDIDETRGVFTIADSRYSIQDKVVVFSNDEVINFSQISEDDILTIVGQDKKILSVNVTTGHGTLALKNTKLFEGSLLQLNKNIFAEIFSNMEIEVPEGKYTLVVANDGWGGSKEIEIVRGETTEVDLDKLKGEGKQKGMITFQINIEGAKVYIDNKLVDHTKPLELTYGTHTVEISAPGYTTWKKHLSVNSKEATIVIELEKEEAESESESQKPSESESQSESQKPSESQSESQKPSESESQSESQKPSESQSESQKPSESESQSESQKPSESESQSESQKPSESESQSESQKPSESESESQKPSESETDKDDDDDIDAVIRWVKFLTNLWD